MPPRASRGGVRGRGGRGGRGAAAPTSSSRASVDEASSQDNPQQPGEPSDGSTLPQGVPDEGTGSDSQSNRPTPASSRQSQTPSAPTRAGSRFKPKNVRRDAAERQRLAEERDRDLAIKIKAEERELRAEERRARRGRGRGDISQRGLVRRTVTATGPFSAIAQENVKDGVGRGTWGGASGGFGPKGENDLQFRMRYQPRREHEARVNIDLLNGLTDGHAEDGTPLYQPSRYSQKSTGNLPVGLLRMQHEEAEVKVKTQAELEEEDRQSSEDEDGLFVDSPVKDHQDMAINDDNEVWHAAPKSQVKVKSEPGTGPEAEDIDMADIPEAQPKAPPSPEVKKKPIIGEDGAAVEQAIIEKKKRKEKKKAQDPEFMHASIDLEHLIHGLSLTAPVEGQEGQEKDDQLFLFQIPPILPPLEKPTNGLNGNGEGVDLTSSADPRVKTEEGTETSQATFDGLPAGGGYVGKLNVRKSGKVELDWGGTTMHLGMGTETEFLTSAIMLEQHEDADDPEASTGFAYGMGQVMGKYILTPVWDDEEEWDPSLDEIYGNGEVPT
ncbi:RNA polymerase III RPC4-domain-containing protein [Biscogniauxia mediterranea]|nr:RNA polymerase III RPC4-domain-containing protein [Biscogniauxia mediterranea]